MKSYAWALLFVAASLCAQQTTPANPSNTEATGRVAGQVICSDTGKPARFAGIQLMSDQSAKQPLIDPAQLSAAAGSGTDKSNLDFGKLITTGLSAMMKGSNLTTMTALEGNFSLDKVPAGTYYVIPQFPGYLSPISLLSSKERSAPDKATILAVESKAQKIVVVPGGTSNLEIELDRGGVIGGTVRYDDGTPAPSVTPVLMVQDKDGKWDDLASPSMLAANTNDQGQFRFSGLPPGKYAVKAALPTTSATMGVGAGSLSMHMNPGDALIVYSGDALWAKDVKPVGLGAGEVRNDVDVEFPIDGLHVISGSVVAKSDGHPVNVGSVELQDPSDKTIKLRTDMIGRDGRFQFNYVPNGSYRLQVTFAADVELDGTSSDEPYNPIAIWMKARKPLKKYDEAGMMLTLPGNSEGLTLQVSEVAK